MPSSKYLNAIKRIRKLAVFHSRHSHVMTVHEVQHYQLIFPFIHISALPYYIYWELSA